MKRRIAIVFATGMALFGMLLPAFIAEEVRREYAPSRTYTETPPPSLTFPSPWIVDEHPYRGLTEPRKDRP